MRLLCRFLLKAENVPQATSRGKEVGAALQRVASGAKIKVEPPKAKSAGSFEAVATVDSGDAKFLAAALGTGWEWHSEGTSAVWAREKGGKLLLPHVYWLELKFD